MGNESEGIATGKALPPKFINAIPLVVFNILISYAYYFSPKSVKEVVVCLGVINAAHVMFYFKIYLQNLQAVNAVKWAQWAITCYKIIAVCQFLGILHHILMRKVPIVADLPVLNTFFDMLCIAITLVCMLVLEFYVSLRLGNALQKINNDETGLLNKMGIAYVYVLFTLVVCLCIIFFCRPLRLIYLAPDNLWLRLLINTLCNIPNILMIALYYRAQKRKAL